MLLKAPSSLCSLKSSLLIHAGLLPYLLYFLLVRMACLELQEVIRLSLSVSQLFWILLLSRTIHHGILPSKNPKRLKSVLLKSGGVPLLFALLSRIRSLNSTISWSLQPRLPPAFTSMTSSSLFGLSPTECRSFLASQLRESGSCSQCTPEVSVACAMLCCPSNRWKIFDLIKI